MKFKKGDTVRLIKHGQCFSSRSKAYSISWSDWKDAYIGSTVVLQDLESITEFWIVRADNGRIFGWPEEGMELVSNEWEVPTQPSISLPKAEEKPQWKISRAISWQHGHCQCGCPRELCDFHKDPAPKPAASFGEGFAHMWKSIGGKP